MSKIDYQALREAAQNAKDLGGIKNYKRGEQAVAEFESLITPHIVLALLDELDKWKQESSAWQAVAEKQLALATDAEKRIAELESLTAPQLPQPAVPNNAATAIRACLDEFPEDVRDIVEECASIAENACRPTMPQCSEPATDNTSQQFESLAKIE